MIAFFELLFLFFQFVSKRGQNGRHDYSYQGVESFKTISGSSK